MEARKWDLAMPSKEKKIWKKTRQLLPHTLLTSLLLAYSKDWLAGGTLPDYTTAAPRTWKSEIPGFSTTNQAVFIMLDVFVLKYTYVG